MNQQVAKICTLNVPAMCICILIQRVLFSLHTGNRTIYLVNFLLTID